MSKSNVYFKISVHIRVKKDANEYHSFCPAFKGLHSCGDTIKEAIDNAKTAVIAYIGSLIKHHEPIPCCEIVREEFGEQNTKLYCADVKINMPAVTA